MPAVGLGGVLGSVTEIDTEASPDATRPVADEHGPAAAPASLSRRTVLTRSLALVAAMPVIGALAGCSDDAARDGPEENTATVNDTEQRYREGAFGTGGLSLPSAPDGLVPVVVLVHGGFWRSGYERDLMEPLARGVVARGWAAWNLDYRAVGDGGGWPTTFTDVAEGVDHLVSLAGDAPLDLARVVVVGHSAGGSLALWTAARAKLPAGSPGSNPAVRPVAVVSQAGVNNLVAGALEDLGGGAVIDLMGGTPGDAGDAYERASPVESLPLDVAQLLVHGEDDTIVPPEQSTAYAAKAVEAGDPATATVRPGDHFSVIDPGHPLGRTALDWIAGRVT